MHLLSEAVTDTCLWIAVVVLVIVTAAVGFYLPLPFS